MAPLRVLIVDDQRDAGELMQALLQLEGHHVEWVATGRAAIETGRQPGWDVMLLDIHLPDVSGGEVAVALADRRAAGMSIVALTGHDARDFARWAKRDHFDRVFVKSVDEDGLLAYLSERAGRLGDKPPG